MMKKVFSIILCLTLSWSLVGCELNLGDSNTLKVELEDYVEEVKEESSIIVTESLQYPITLKLGCSFSTNHPLMSLLQEFADKVKSGTNSNVIIKICPDESLGGENELVNKVETGEIAMALASSTVYANRVPAAGASSLPFVFDTSDMAWDFIKNNMKDLVADSFNDYNLHYLISLDDGFDVILTSEDAGPIRNVTDLENKIIGTTGGQEALETLDELHTTAMFANSEETLKGEINDKKYSGCEYSLADAYYGGVYEYTRFVALTDHSYESLILSINEDLWKNMESDYRDVINKAIKGMDDESREIMVSENENCLNLLRNEGMIASDPKMALYFTRAAYNVITMYVKLYPADLRKLIVNYQRKSTIVVAEGESTIDDYDESLYEKPETEDYEVNEEGFLE